MIEGAVATGGRKRSVWWVDPVLGRPIIPTRWLAAFLLPANLLLAIPRAVVPWPEAWARGESMAGGIVFGAALVFLTQGTRAAGSGTWRLAYLGAMGTSVANLLAVIWRLAEARGLPAVHQTWREFAAWAAVAVASGFLLDRLDRRLAASDLRDRQLREARDAALRARLAPHFIFNALGTLQAQIEKDPAGASATTDALARLFRQALAAAGRPLVPLREELEFVEAYLGIERARLGDRLRVKVEVPEELEEVEIPPLSLQVLVENAVRHGIAPREDGGEIRIRATRSGPGENPGVVLSVENPLAGSSRPGTGNGLETLRGRLASPGDLTVTAANGVHRAEFWWSAA